MLPPEQPPASRDDKLSRKARRCTSACLFLFHTSMSSSIPLNKLAELVGGEILRGDPRTPISGLNSIVEAQPGEVTFLGNDRYAEALATTRASAVLVARSARLACGMAALIAVENPTLAFSTVIRHFIPAAAPAKPGVHASAVVAPGVSFDAGKVHIGACAIVEEGASLGDGCVVHAGAFVGKGASLGPSCVLHPNSTVRERCVLGARVIIHAGAVIGSDGFGYEFTQGRNVKVEQVGIVRLDDDVEVGSCATIDRARFGLTWIGEGTKIDNLVQIAHNVVVGKHCVIVSQVGIAGSTHVGDCVTLAGQVGVAGHLEIGSGVTVLAKSGVTKSITEPGVYTGFPARPLIEGRKLMALPAKIPDMLARLRELERRLSEMESAAKDASS